MVNSPKEFSLQREVEDQNKKIAKLEREIMGLTGKLESRFFKNGVPFSAPIGDELVTFPKGSKFIVEEPFDWVSEVITLKPIMDIEPDNPTFIRLSDKSWDELFCQVMRLSDIRQ